MKQKFLIATCTAGLLLLSACNSADSSQGNNNPVQGRNNNDRPTAVGRQNAEPRQGGPRMSQEDLQQYIEEANASPDRTELTKEAFEAELLAAREEQMAQMQQGEQMPRGGGNPRFGSGGDFPMGQGPSGGMNQEDLMVSATTFLKYTDLDGNTVLLALDADGQVVMKWPMAFSGGRPFPPAR